jgi:hypothetical protein
MPVHNLRGLIVFDRSGTYRRFVAAYRLDRNLKEHRMKKKTAAKKTTAKAKPAKAKGKR